MSPSSPNPELNLSPDEEAKFFVLGTEIRDLLDAFCLRKMEEGWSAGDLVSALSGHSVGVVLVAFGWTPEQVGQEFAKLATEIRRRATLPVPLPLPTPVPS